MLRKHVKAAYEEDAQKYKKSWRPLIKKEVDYFSPDLCAGLHKYLFENGPIEVQVHNEDTKIGNIELTTSDGKTITPYSSDKGKKYIFDPDVYNFLRTCILDVASETHFEQGQGDAEYYSNIYGYGQVWFDLQGRTVLEYLDSTWKEPFTYVEAPVTAHPDLDTFVSSLDASPDDHWTSNDCYIAKYVDRSDALSPEMIRERWTEGREKNDLFDLELAQSQGAYSSRITR